MESALTKSGKIVDSKVDSRPVVFSFVANAGTNDARVMKQARALVGAGYRVRIYGRLEEGFAERELVDGIEVVRFPCFDYETISIQDAEKAISKTGISPGIFSNHLRSLVDAREEISQLRVEQDSTIAELRETLSRLEEIEASISSIAKEITDKKSQLFELSAERREIKLHTPKLGKKKIAARRKLHLIDKLAQCIEHVPVVRNFINIRATKLFKEAKRNYRSISSELKEAAERSIVLAANCEVLQHEINGANDNRAVLQKERDSIRVKRSLHKATLRSRNHKERIAAASVRLKESLYFCRYMTFALNFPRESIDVEPVVLHAHDLYPLFAAVLLGAETGAKVIFDAHEIETERVPPLPPERKSFIDQLERGLFTQTDQIITCCDSSTDFYSERFSRRIPQVVMNAPDFEDMSRLGEPNLRGILGLRQDVKILVYAGGVGREARGLDKVAAALRELPNVHLVILGPRHRKNDEWLLSVATSQGVADRIHLLPSVPASEVVSYLRSGDAGICPIQDVSLSYRYAMPNKLFEMTFADLPIVVSDLPEMGKFVRELGNGVTVDQEDPGSIAEGIRQVLGERRQYALTASAKDRLLTTYSWPAQANKLLATYQDLIQGQ